MLETGKRGCQSRADVKRALQLCDECFERLRADQLNDLFLQVVGEQK
jgi:hypothetical protein